MRLVHFSKNPFVFFDRGRDYKNRDYSSRFNKPNGLWLSDEDAYGWSELVTTENWTGKEDTLAYGIEFEVLDWSRVLHIKDELDFLYFEEDFKDRKKTPDPNYEITCIKWSKVAESYGGILITPYLWTMRDHPWYHGWDCASGCFWNLSLLEPKIPFKMEYGKEKEANA